MIHSANERCPRSAKYVLLDEPFSGVEPLLVEHMKHLITEYVAMNRGVLVTDHDYQNVIDISDDAYFMAGGVCRLLDGELDLREQLRHSGYV